MGAPPPQYEPIVTEGNEALVHHMEVFQCAAEVESVPHFSGPCDSKMKPERLNYCRHVLAAWALGAKVRALPASPQGAPRVSTGGSLGGPQRAPLPTASMLLGSQGFFGATDASSSSVPFLVGIVLVPRQVPLDLEGAVHRVVPGLAALAASRVFPQLSGGAWAVGSPGGKSSPHSLTSSLTGALCGLVMSCPSVGECCSNLAAPPTPTPALAARALARGWVCPDPPGTPLVPALSVCLG